MHGDALSSWTGSGTGILRTDHRRQRPNGLRDGLCVLARQLNPLQIGAEFSRYHDAAQRLVRSPWAHHRIVAIADALLRNGSLSGDEILDDLASNQLSRRIRVVHAP